ncbi:hypothetical protein K474DRAFT_1771869 [Panus rudis PR-1116 ss-1]|nr:hypothetical protein K474DRAFT_1771869 [Panus rudis PR-1116 ss-1]
MASTLAFNPKMQNARFNNGSPSAPPPTTWEEFTPAELISASREALAVWHHGNKPLYTRVRALYGFLMKVYGTDNQKAKAQKALDDAIAKGIPTANALIQSGRVWTTDKPRWVASFAVIADYYSSPWEFFSAQGASGISKFTTLIKKITNKTALQSLHDAFQKAVDFKLSDPQGFINPNTTSANVQFIDIHQASTAPKTEQMLEIIDAQLAKAT